MKFLLLVGLVYHFAWVIQDVSGESWSQSSSRSPKCFVAQKICSEKVHYFNTPREIKNALALVASWQNSPGSANEECHADVETCMSQFGRSIRALNNLLTNEVLGDICTLNTYERLRDFHDRFISIYGPEYNKEILDLKIQVNAACERQLVARVTNGELEDLLEDEDFELLEKFKHESHRAFGYTYVERARRFKNLKILASNRIPKGKNTCNKENRKQETSPEEVSIASSSAGEQQHESEEKSCAIEEDDKLYMQVKFGDNIKKVKDACEYKFRPIYEELFRQVIMLNNLGYKDRINTVRERELLNEDKQFTRWYEIIENCELLKNVEVIQDSSVNSAIKDLVRAASPLNAISSSANTITLLTKEEYLAAKERIASKISKEGAASVYEPIKDDSKMIEHKALEFTPRLYLTGEIEQTGEVKRFERRITRLISRETNFLSIFIRDTKGWIKRTFYKNKLQFKNKDQGSAIGRFASFIERHKVALRVIATFLGIMVITVHFAG